MVIVTVNVDVKRVLEINEVDNLFEIQQSIGLKWRDPRLLFHNLRPLADQNTLTKAEKNEIWVPTVTFVNTAQQERSRRDNSSLVIVSRDGGFSRSGREVVDNIYIYKGAENPLLISRVYSTKWLCTYDMLYYPFDTQRCSLLLVPSGNTATQLQLVPGNHTYSGNRELTQYFIRQSSIQMEADNMTLSVEVDTTQANFSSGGSWAPSSWCLHDHLHANYPHEYHWTFHTLLQTFFL